MISMEHLAEKPVKIPENEFIEDSLQLLKAATEKGIVLRIMGALAIRLHSDHSEECKDIFTRLNRLGEGRSAYTDLDLAAYSKQNKMIKEFMEKDRGYEPRRMLNACFGDRRMAFSNTRKGYGIDIFFDKLEFSHDVYWGKDAGKDRLELDCPTLNLSDLVLEKIQIHQINFKDIVDLNVLFMFHDVHDTVEEEHINGKYVARILSDDWGFWYDATNNLKKAMDAAKKFLEEGRITQMDFENVQERIQKLLGYIDSEPKTKNWNKRAEKGIRRPWYREVEEIYR